MGKLTFFCFFGIFFVLLLQNVSANFVCGEVQSSDDNMSSSWFDVQVSFLDNPLEYTSCQVSPEDNRYCCDSEAISETRKWKIGDEVSAKIVDSELGYFAGPVNLITTGEGYGVFPSLKLKKVINIFHPSKNLILSNSSSIFFNASFLSPFNFVTFEKNGLFETLCTNCSFFSDYLNFSYGNNEYSFFANFGNLSFNESGDFTLLNFVHLNRSFDCRGCKNGNVKSNRLVYVNLNLNLSHTVSNISFKEYVPISWKIQDLGGGVLQNYSSTHNVILWNLSGKNLVFRYSAISPNVLLFPIQEEFFSELEDMNLGSENITTFRFFTFFKSKRKIVRNFFNFKKFKKYHIGPNKPLVFYNKHGLYVLALYPTGSKKNAYFEMVNLRRIQGINDKPIFIDRFNTNLNSSDIDSVDLEFNLKKKFIDNKKYSKLRFFVLDLEGNWAEKDFSDAYWRDGVYYYRFNSEDPIEGIAVFGVQDKGNFFDWMRNLFG